MEMQPGERLWQALEGIAGAIWVLVILFVTLLAVRDHITAETAGLALMVPVLVAALSGRALALAMAVACALIFNVFFIKPYYTLSIGSSEGWTAFIVYILVAVAIAFIAGRLRQARDHEERRVQRRMELLAIAELLLRGEQPAEVLAERAAPFSTALGLEVETDAIGDGTVRYVTPHAPDPDQAATLEALERLLEARAGILPVGDPGTPAFWDLG